MLVEYRERDALTCFTSVAQVIELRESLKIFGITVTVFKHYSKYRNDIVFSSNLHKHCDVIATARKAMRDVLN